MKNLKNYILLAILSITFIACENDDIPVANNIVLAFNNTFKGTTIVLGTDAATATVNTSEAGQTHYFSELKYVISNIRLINTDGIEIPYNINNLDNGATVVDHSKSVTLQYVLNEIPTAEYTQIKFGLGVKSELNTLDQVSFPNFYALAGANDTEMMWEWGTGYRFTKIEGFYDVDDKELSIHTGSTIDGTQGDESTYVPGVDAYRDITLNLPTNAIVGSNAPLININVDFDKLLSGDNEVITLSSGTAMPNNATPNIHTAVQMTRFVDNIGGNGTSNVTGMFSITSVEN
ncbi:hypothetical protein MKD41_06010 [Lutibacter sp. A64]|uniref:MbnP family protein n=1 Tax=Lutibacter sp. A64 TaxID=2918526 RepID=UPI001F06DB74|nr:MbnP family protein [Lutibacter sp. A64]UMB55026.1 hypothetical protein MKD41_06010 [Lutibacter sp. A64]